MAVGLFGIGAVGVDELARGFERRAHASVSSRGQFESPPIDLGTPAVLQPLETRVSVFDGIADHVLLEPLRDAEVERVRFNKGGSSISLRIDFDNGARAAFKPRQINLQTIPRREVAAYRLNRLLGQSYVAPAMGRRFRVEDLVAKLDPRDAHLLPRLQAELIVEDGWVIGEVSWWIPVIGHASVDGFRIDSVPGIVTWKRYLTAGEPVPFSQTRMIAQISDMVLWDFLINNMDRWSGGNARTSEDGSVLYFMDNTLSFGPAERGHLKSRIYFERSQKFSRRTITALRALDEHDVRAVLGADVWPFDELLSDGEIVALMSRRDFALKYIDSLIAEHGEENVLVFP